MPVGTSYRAILTALLSIPFVIVVGEVLGYVLPLYNSNHWLVDALQGVADNALAIAFLGALMMIVAAAVTQSRVRA